jgi:hypothetical protein
MKAVQDGLEERIKFLDPELKSAHNRIDVLETFNEANAENIDKVRKELRDLKRQELHLGSGGGGNGNGGGSDGNGSRGSRSSSRSSVFEERIIREFLEQCKFG